MDTIQVRFIGLDNKTARVEYSWFQNTAKFAQKKGVITIRFAGRYESGYFDESLPVFAEIAALYELMEGAHRVFHSGTPSKLSLQVSFGAIKKATAKSAIKRGDSGKTAGRDVATFANFLATKYFFADYIVDKTDPLNGVGDKTVVKDFDIDVADVPNVTIDTIHGPVSVSRHALNRAVERVVGLDWLRQGVPMDKLPNDRWVSAWKYLERVLPVSVLRPLSKQGEARTFKKYGGGSHVLFDNGSKGVFVIKQESYGLVLVTMFIDHPGTELFIPLMKVKGQHLVRA